MRTLFAFFCFFFLLFSCKQEQPPVVFSNYDESTEIKQQQEHKLPRMRFKRIQSPFLDKNVVFEIANKELRYFSEEDYNKLKPLVLEKSIPELQQMVTEGTLTYEKLTLFYLYRMRKFESNNKLSLNAIIALNPDAVAQARELDKNRPKNTLNSLYGMPILLKDNINTAGMPTTAGAYALKDNKNTEDAFIVKKLKDNGAVILGKVNLSEWAYYFCSGCPVGYSAMGGQTLNPYGRKVFETGGSSSGSGVAVAANYAVAAIGTETAGSILSPSGQNSVVGLKPTIGLLSRTGIVPISSTLDTPGPMTKTVIDNAILLQALLGKDSEDSATNSAPNSINYTNITLQGTLKGKRLGVLESLLTDSLYAMNVNKIKEAGAEIVIINPKRESLQGFLTLLNIDMKHDLPNYLLNHADTSVKVKSVKDVIAFNIQDSLNRMPYNQELFDGIVADTTSIKTLGIIKDSLHNKGKRFFSKPIQEHSLDAVLSINNYHAGLAAVAKYPCLTVPMGFKTTGEPVNLTFIGKPFKEDKLLQLGYAFEQLTKARKPPVLYN